MATLPRISQNSAVLLEKARSLGLSDEQLLHIIETNDITPLADSKTDYSEWVSYAREHQEDLAAAVAGGYQMTFNTVYGLKNWLKFRYGVEAEKDYTEGEGRFDGLTLDEAEARFVQAALASNWVVLVEPQGDAQVVHLVMRAFYQPEA